MGGGAAGAGSQSGGPKSDRQIRDAARAARRARDAEAGLDMDGLPLAGGKAAAAASTPAPAPNFSLAGLGGLPGQPAEPEPWATPLAWAPSDGPLPVGTVLLGNPEVFCSADCPAPLLEMMLLSAPLPLAELGAMQCASIMPVVIVVDAGDAAATSSDAAAKGKGGFFGTGFGAGPEPSTAGGPKGLMLNRRTGYLMADLKMDVAGFMIQPLCVGGREGAELGVTMLHPYAEVKGAAAVTDAASDAGGLFFGGEFADAQALVKRGTGSQFVFKFFVQATAWGPGGLEQQVAAGAWHPARVSKEVLLKIRERDGTRGLPPKPLWTEAMELCGGAYASAAAAFLNSTQGGGEVAPSGFAEDP